MKEVLIIDQTKPIRMRLVDICKSMNLTAHEASDSSSAMSILSKHGHNIGFIIMDIKFDQFDGFALLERIKHQYENIPVMILTSSNRRSDFIYGLKSGALDYVLKPFDDINLITRISKLMRNNKPAAKSAEVIVDPSVNLKDMIQMEIKKAQKGQYVFELFMLLIYKPLKSVSSHQDEEYSKYLKVVYPEIENLFWETDHLTMFGTQLILGVLPFCDEDGFSIVERKIADKIDHMKIMSNLPNEYNWALSHQLMPSSSGDSAESIIDRLQNEVRKQIAQAKMDEKAAKEA